MPQESPAPSASLAENTIGFLRRYPPFDEMDAGALDFLATRARLAYYPQNTVILAPGQGEPQSFHIVKRGLVHCRRTEPGAATLLTFRPGEFFPVGALIESRSVNDPYTAAADTFCLEIPRGDFLDLLARSSRFHAFATRYLTSLLKESRRLLKMQLSGASSEQQIMNRTLRSLITRPPVCCEPGTPLGEALRMMQQERVGSIVARNPDESPAGIFTRHDLLERVALARADLEQPIASFMTPDPFALKAEASAFEAALAMAERKIRHLPVIDEGRVIGIVTERDLYALQRISTRQINREISSARETEDLARSARSIRRLAATLLGQGVAAEQITLIISTLNDTLVCRILEIEAARCDLAGIEWCWLSFGSEGRYEQTISTDQDNGLIFAEREGVPAEDSRERLLPFARAANRTLDACGFPLCPGNIMAGNPQWCLSAAEWRHQFESWISDTDPQALLNAAIFFDFRPLYGRHDLSARLRTVLLASTGGNSRFLRQMAEQALVTAPPLGVLRDFVVDKDGTIDLKKSGARLFVDAARVFGLATGTAHTSTAQRLRHGGPRMNMPEQEISAAVDAFFFIQLLRLRQQVGAEPGEASNSLDPAKLNEVDRRILKESFRQARRLQSRLALDYQL